MSEPATTEDEEQRRKDWLQRLADEIDKIEQFTPKEFLTDDSEYPQWVQNIQREFSLIMLPAAKIRDPKWERTPKRMGALIGHICEMAMWMMEWFADVVEKYEDKECAPLTDEDIKKGEESLESFNAWYRACRRLAKRTLCSCVDQGYQDMSDFLLGYADGFSRKPKKFGYSDIGNTTTEIYQMMLVYWRVVDRMDSVRVLHEWLVKIFGPYRAGDQKRIEKLCQRNGLSFRKAGRPKKK